MAIIRTMEPVCSECGAFLDKEELDEEVCSLCKGEHTAIQEDFYYCDICDTVVSDTKVEFCPFCKSQG